MYHWIHERCPAHRTVIACVLLLSITILATRNYHGKIAQERKPQLLRLTAVDQTSDQPLRSDHQQVKYLDPQVIQSYSSLNSMLNDSILLPTSVNMSFTSDRPLHWTPDWYENYDNLGILLSKRREDIIKRCSILNNSKQFQMRSVPTGYRYEQKLTTLAKNIRYCSTKKAGFTFWKKFRDLIPNHPYTPKEGVTFTVTRNPWHRLVSVWRDRFTLPKPGLAQHFMRMFCKGKSWKSLPPFSEFIEKCFLANWRSHFGMKGHWVTVMDRCQVCSRPDQLQFFIAQENMNAEASYILEEHAGITNATKFLNSVHKSVLRPGVGIEGLSPEYQDEYKTLTAQQINQIWNIYKYEIYLFDYPWSPFVDFRRA